ncbi:ABC transporter permease [Novilysobacter spongiicola]|uniref:Lipoprotein-releasing system permease protein n=1 Tax=Lysobacter spongiicola DSM 21749 TaxID=1122188 RepID=A0A1T4S9Y4_9GAMM|nr:ABC transporter permease [Lysobacter spongiicola]SKA24997.1 lipoprotein-releasing system permease protein [Lysobacter spongiicola DSM 21749]
MWIEWTIATKFLREGKAQSVLILVGIAVGVAVIVFLTALITGLQGNIIERTLGTQAHIKVEPADEANRILAPAEGTVQLVLESRRAQRLRSINNWQQVRDVLDTLPRITAVSPVISGPAFARRGEALESVALVGIDAERYQRIIPIQDDIVEGEFRIGAGDVVVGRQLAIELGMRAGDKMRIDGGQGRESVVNVAGVFELGVRELDARYVYLDMKQAQSLLNLPGAATIIDVTVDDIFAAKSMASRIARLTGLKAESWMETNAQLMNALRSQSLSTQMISVFVALSVALGIASVLSVSVVQRTREIGILRAMGTTRRQMLGVFLIQGALFGLAGSLLGGAAGYGLVAAFNTFGPKLFYIPVDQTLLMGATLLATLTGIVSAALPARRASRLDPVEAIRHV